MPNFGKTTCPSYFQTNLSLFSNFLHFFVFVNFGLYHVYRHKSLKRHVLWECTSDSLSKNHVYSPRERLYQSYSKKFKILDFCHFRSARLYQQSSWYGVFVYRTSSVVCRPSVCGIAWMPFKFWLVFTLGDMPDPFLNFDFFFFLWIFFCFP